MAMSVAGPPAPPPGWWIMKRVFGRQTRRSLGAAMKICVPALATQPVPMVVIGERTKRITSWIASPDSTWPPGEEMRTLIGASDSSASAISRVHVARAVWWLISPNTSTKRDLKASRSTTASVRSAGSGLSSLASMPEWYNADATPFRLSYIFPAMRKRFARASDLGLTAREFAVLRRLDTPQKIQAFLHGLRQNFELDGQTCRSVREVLRSRRAHCIEGAMLAAAALWIHGEPPLLLDMRAERDYDHVVSLFRRHGRWGAISKTNGIGLRGRDPVYQSLRELAMSYFHEYTNRRDHKTLREYSVPFDLRRIDTSLWVSGNKTCWDVCEELDELRHFRLMSRRHLKAVTRRDPFERRVNRVLQYARPRALVEKMIARLKRSREKNFRFFPPPGAARSPRQSRRRAT